MFLAIKDTQVKHICDFHDTSSLLCENNESCIKDS